MNYFPFKNPSLSIFLGLIGAVGLYYISQMSGYPEPDGAQMFSHTQEVYVAFRDLGFWEGFKHAYFHKHWRPLAFPVLAAPVLFISGGNILVGLKLLSAATLSVSLLLVYRLLNLAGRSSFTIFFAAIFLLSSMFVFSITTRASEIFIVTAGLTMFFFWFKNQGQLIGRRDFYYFASAWAWASLCRPVEGLAFGLPMLLYSLVLGWRAGLIPKKDIVLTFALSLGAAMAIAYPFLAFPPDREWSSTQISVLSVLFLFLGGGLFWQQRSKPYSLLKGTSLYLLPNLLWYLSGATTLLGWVFHTTYGPLAVQNGRASGHDYLEFWQSLAMEIGLAPLLIIFWGLISVREAKSFVRYAYFALFTGVVLSSLTFNWEHRYVYLNFLGLVLLSGVVLTRRFIAAQPKERIISAAVIAAVVLGIVLDWQYYLRTNKAIGWAGRGPRLQLGTDGKLLRQLSDALSQHIVEQEATIGFLMSDARPSINGWNLQMAAIDAGKKWAVSSLMFLDEMNLENADAEIYRKYNYWVVGPLQLENARFGLNRLTADQLFKCSGSCLAGTLQKIAEIQIKAGENQEKAVYHVLRSKLSRAAEFAKSFD